MLLESFRGAHPLDLGAMSLYERGSLKPHAGVGCFHERELHIESLLPVPDDPVTPSAEDQPEKEL